MSSTRRKQNNPTKSASDLKKKARVSRAAKAALSTDQDAEPSLARSRPQRKIIPKRPLSPDIELSSRRKRRRKKKAPSTKAKSKNPNLGPTRAVHIQPNELKPPKLSKQHKASLKKKKKRKKKTFIFPILASDRIPRDLAAATSDKSESDAEGSIPVDLGAKIKKKKSKASSRNILDIGQLRMLPAADLVRKFSKHTSFKIPSEDSNATVQKQHVYACRMLPHYCTEKFYGNEEDTKRQITKHLLRHVGELLTVTDRGLNLLPQTVKKPRPKKKNKKGIPDPVPPPSDDIKSAMYILPSAPRPMRVTLPKNVSSRMKRSSYTVIRSGGDNEIMTEVVLLPKGRLLSMFNAPSKISKGAHEDGTGEDGLVRRDEEREEEGETSSSKLMPLGRAPDKVEFLPLGAASGKREADGDSTSTGLSIESLAEAVEALVSKESRGLNIQAAEALAKELTVVKEQPGESDVEVTSDSISSKSELLSLSGSTAPSSLSKPSSSTTLKKPVKVKKVGKRSKKSVTIIHAGVPSLVKCPYPDHSYAYAKNVRNYPLHLDSYGRPMDEPFIKEEIEFGLGHETNRLTDSMNVELNQLIAGMEDPQTPSRVKVLNENEVPVVWEGANETVEHVAMQRKQKKIKLKVVPTNSGPSEEVKQTAMFHLQSLTKDRKRKGPFECQICHKHLTAASTLRAHYRSHAGIKPYQCEQCNATFTRLHSLKYHTMIHNEEARFLCSYCHRQFRHSSHYREHLRRHTGEEPFGCSDCSARFKTRNTYKRHLRSKHGKVVAENGKINLAPANMLSLAGTAISLAPAPVLVPPTPPIPSVTG